MDIPVIPRKSNKPRIHAFYYRIGRAPSNSETFCAINVDIDFPKGVSIHEASLMELKRLFPHTWSQFKLEDAFLRCFTSG